MPLFDDRVPTYRPAKDVLFDWSTFKKGLNILLQENEIEESEVAQIDNMMLVGKGVPTKRWGTKLYYQSGNATGSVRGLKGFYPSAATSLIELLAVTDDGYLTKRSNASYSMITGASWASGNDVYMAQLDNRMYIANGQRELVRYSSPTLVGFPTITRPTITGASNISNASGTSTKSYRMTSVSNVGETLASDAFELKSQPASLGGIAGGVVRLTFNTVSTASGILQGYNLYGRDAGNERFLGFINSSATIFLDDGSAVVKEFTYPPTADSTGGPNAKYLSRFQDRLVFGGLVGEPTKLLISGRVPNHEKFDLSFGGNFIKIEPDAGDNIAQVAGFTDRIIVFKEKSIWQVKLISEQIGNFFVTTPTLQLITSSLGCIAPKSVVAVENDVFFLSRRGVFSLGFQQNFVGDNLRTNEISVKIRTYFKNLTIAQKAAATATYKDGKYIIAFPGKGQMMVFDRERVSWYGPWNLDSTVFETFYDESNNEHLLFAQEDSVNVDELSENFSDDKGTAIQTILRTKSEEFGDWSLFKNIRNLFVQMRNVTGTVSVDIQLETRTGQSVVAKSFNITPASGNTGWGSFMWGGAMWGDSPEKVGGADAVVTIRWANLNKLGRTMQLVFKTTATDANYELLGIRGDVKPIGRGASPSSWRV